MSHYDVMIVGAGPAGIAASIELAKAGWKVLLIEKSVFPRIKVCGGFIGPENRSILEHYDVLDQVMGDGASRVTHIHLSSPDGSDVRVPLRFRGRDDFGIGFSRERLDELLVDKAKTYGVTFMDQSVVQENQSDRGRNVYLISDRGRHQTVEVQATIRINAYGAQHQARRSSERVFGVSGIFDTYDQKGSSVTMHFVHQGHVGINHFEKNRVNVCYVVKDSLFKECRGNYDALWQMFKESNPWIKRQFEHSSLMSAWKGTFVDLNRPLRFFDGTDLYVGDAMGIIHPVAGGGISFAFNSGILLASLLSADKPAEIHKAKVAHDYARIWKKNYYWPMKISKYVGQLGHHRLTANMVIRLLRWREANIHQLFDSFHKPVSFHKEYAL